MLTEESDVNWNDQPQSHFGMYLEAMEEVGVDLAEINLFIEKIR